MDFSLRKIIANNNALICFGYSKNEIEKKGFDFFKDILDENEFTWLQQVYSASFQVFLNFSKNERMHLMLSLDLTVKNKDGTSFILLYKITPFKLCEHGKLWIGLCKISISAARKMDYTATITNTLTGRKYDFKNNSFQLRNDDDALTPEDEQIIMFLIQGMEDTEMCKKLNLSKDQLKRTKQKIYK
ncbi:MAG: hypothetical protein LBU91_08410, partial [Bacteroidales bacterium]|nr:hypothetical protein [Bacteroidales bacterium]